MIKTRNTKSLIWSIVIKTLIVAFCVLGVVFTAKGDNYMAQKLFLYFTIQSNICIALISLVFIVFDIIKFKKPNFVVPNLFYIIKFVFTVAITLTFIVFSLMLTPELIIIDQASYLITLENICLHNLCPILAIVDFFVFDKIVFKKHTFVYGIFMPLYYLIFSLICSLIGIDFGDGLFMPYFFLDYKENGWFRLGGGKVGVAYWIVILLLVLLGLGFVLMWVKNRVEKIKQSKIVTVEQKS